MKTLNSDDAGKSNAGRIADLVTGDRMLHDPAAPRFSSVDD